MRARRRYLAVHVLSEGRLPSEVEYRSAVWQQLQALYGELGVSRIGFWLVIYNGETGESIIRCEHDQVRPLRAALASLTHIGPTMGLLHVKGISGTIRKAKTLLPKLRSGKNPI